MKLAPVIHFTEQQGYDHPLPYHPPERYPELDFLGEDVCPGNQIYAGVREMLRALGYDAARLGTPDWSPLSDLVAPGGCVVLKPNYVRHYSDKENGNFDTVVTHLAVMRPVVDYALKAVGPEGTVMIADAPQYDCDVDVLLERVRMQEFLAWYRTALGREVEFRDLRVEFGRHIHGIQLEKRKLPGDPEGYAAVDLGDLSEFTGLPDERLQLLRGADYDEEVTIRHHSAGRNEYLVSKTILNADLVVNLPKIKTHKKTGVTLAMKNLIGINGDKNWLPHYRAGFPNRGGDEFPKPDAYARFRAFGAELARGLLKRGIGAALFRRIRAMEEATGLGERTRNGNWFGNDTIWRTTLDLNLILYHGDRQGQLGQPSRRVLNIYDGIIAGEGDGPMAPDDRPVGLLVAGEDPGAADCVITWLMGFDWKKIPLLARAVQDLGGGHRITGFNGDASSLPVLWSEHGECREVRFSEIERNLEFLAHPGWAGRIERSEAPLRRAS